MSESPTQERAARLKHRPAYGGATRECDVVMKGGITSGVLYPLAVCELATAYKLRNVGGTSAGAIAAAAAAAAEHGRSSPATGSGFDALAALPAWLGADDHLAGLFRPPRATRWLHALVMRAVRPGASPLVLLASAAVAGGWSRRWWMAVLGLVPGALLLVALLSVDGGDALWWIGLIVAALIGLVGLVLAALGAAVLRAGDALESNLYGIVAGSAAADGGVSLSDWLTTVLDELAGIDPTGRPLTFGDLWGAGGLTSPVVNLEMQTTNVTEGRPYRLPFDLGGTFAFDETEFRRIFPRRVVDHLLACAGDERTPEGLVPLPSASELPVVVATRMSLSFPILVSAVPLYAVDRSMQVGDDERFERCWFSDGGITSNFPVSFFDALLPTRPTFGINLRPFHARHPQQAEEGSNVWMPRTNRSGIVEWWTRWPDGEGIRSVFRFLRAIADTMQNWVDNQQTRVPGYRDRIVHISHSDKEGGANLAMPPTTLASLSERGRCAGERLVEYYTTPPEAEAPAGEERRTVSWENHRWIRLRTSLALVTDAIGELGERLGRDEYVADLAASIDAAPGYPFHNLDQLAFAQAVADGKSRSLDGSAPRVELPAGLRALAGAMRVVERRGPKVPLGVGGPSPAPALRVAAGARVPRRPTMPADGPR